jgi:hypothetical protein
VRVSYPATYVEWAGALRRHAISIDGDQWVLPSGAEVEVLSPPPLPEPGVGGYAEVRTSALPSEVWAHRDEGWLPAYPVDGAVPHTWADLHVWGRGTVLVPADGQPRYEPAACDGRVLWLHLCDHEAQYPVIGCSPDTDPHRVVLGCVGCGPNCPDPDAGWTRLYREVSGA